MEAWVEGMAVALRRCVSITDPEGQKLNTAGSGEGEPLRLPFEVNGVAAGWVEITPGDLGAGWQSLVSQAVAAFQSLAEIRNSMADLVRTTAHQWRELSLLYRFSDLVAGGQDPEALADLVVAQAQRALRGHGCAIAYRLIHDVEGHACAGTQH